MRKQLFAVICLFFVLNAFAGTDGEPQTGKQVYDDDFSQPPVWANWKSANTSGEFRWAANEGYGKKGAMEIAVNNAPEAGGHFCYLKHFPAVAGKKYVASVWVRAENITQSSEIILAFQAQDSAKKFLGTPVASTVVPASKIGDGWKQIILTFVVPTEGKWNETAFLLCTIGIDKAVKGNIFIDDFYFTEEFSVDNAATGEYQGDFSSPNVFSSWKSSSAVGTFSWTQTQGHNSKGAMEITVGKDSGPDAVFCFLKPFPVIPGKTYTVTVWAKAEDISPSSEVIIAFQGQDSAKKFLGTPVISNVIRGDEMGNDWKCRILTFMIPEKEAWSQTAYLLCTIGIKNSNKGKIFFDDINFYEDGK